MIQTAQAVFFISGLAEDRHPSHGVRFAVSRLAKNSSLHGASNA
jgi:hypothetical protein